MARTYNASLVPHAVAARTDVPYCPYRMLAATLLRQATRSACESPTPATRALDRAWLLGAREGRLSSETCFRALGARPSPARNTLRARFAAADAERDVLRTYLVRCEGVDVAYVNAATADAAEHAGHAYLSRFGPPVGIVAVLPTPAHDALLIAGALDPSDLDDAYRGNIAHVTLRALYEDVPDDL